LHTNIIKETTNAFNLGNVQRQKLKEIIVGLYEVKVFINQIGNLGLKPPPH
jgi:ribosome recycling factor